MRCLTVMLVCAVAFLTTSCSNNTRLDASSDEALKKSMERMTAGMSDQQKKQFTEDCLTVVLLDGFKIALEDKGGAPLSSAKMFKPLDGLTVAEIHDKAEEAKKKMQGKK
jgi:hypothetical protein